MNIKLIQKFKYKYNIYINYILILLKNFYLCE